MILFKTLENLVEKLEDWMSRAQLHGCDPFDGLKSPSVKYLTLNNKYFRTAWQQFFKRCPINLRPVVRIKKGIVSRTTGDLTSAY